MSNGETAPDDDVFKETGAGGDAVSGEPPKRDASTEPSNASREPSNASREPSTGAASTSSSTAEDESGLRRRPKDADENEVRTGPARPTILSSVSLDPLDVDKAQQPSTSGTTPSFLQRPSLPPSWPRPVSWLPERRRVVTVPPSSSVRPDVPEHVRDQTEAVVNSFIVERMRAEHNARGDATPAPEEIPELQSQTRNLSEMGQVGMRLSQIAANVDQQYGSDFQNMIDDLIKQAILDADTAYNVFCRIASNVMQNGITWGNIVTLLSFGFRVLVTIYASREPITITNAISWLTRYLSQDNIVRWIAQQGGWLVARSLEVTTEYPLTVRVGGTAVAFASFVALAFHLMRYLRR